MNLLEKWFPRTGNCTVEGMRLAILNSILVGGGGGAVFLLFQAVELLRKRGILIPVPVWLVMIIAVLPYYVLMFQYGRAFGALSPPKRPAAGFAVGFLGQLPTVLLLVLAIRGGLYHYVPSYIWRALFTMMVTLILVAPVMVGLGSLDDNGKGNVKKIKGSI